MPNPKVHGVVAIELSPTFLKLVEFIPSENRVTVVAIEPLERARWGNDTYLEEQLKSALTRHRRADTSDLVSSVAGGHSILRTVEVPEHETNVADALKWDMEQYLARPLDEYLMDYQALESKGSETGRHYLVAAYRRGEVKRFQRLLESAGFPLTVLDVDALSVVNAFDINYPGMKSGRTLLVKADSQSVLCISAQNGMLLDCRNFPVEADIASLDQDRRAGLFLEMAVQIRADFDNAAKTWGAIDTAVLCGDLAVHEKFSETLAANLPVRLICLDAFKEMAFVPDTETGAALMPGAAQCAGALGLALRLRAESPQIRINLLKSLQTRVVTPKSRESRRALAPEIEGISALPEFVQKPRSRGQFLAFVPAILVVAVGVGFYFFFQRAGQLKPDRQEPASIEATVAVGNPIPEPVSPAIPPPEPVMPSVSNSEDSTPEAMAEKIFPGYSRLKPSRQLAIQYLSAIRLLRDLRNAAPPGVGFSEVTITPPGGFYVHGLASTKEEFQHFQKALKSLPGLDHLKNQGQPVGEAGNSSEFHLSGQVRFDTLGMTGPPNPVLKVEKIKSALLGFTNTALALGIKLEPIQPVDSSILEGLQRFHFHTEAICDYSKLEALLEKLQRTSSNLGFNRVNLQARDNETMIASLDLLIYAK